MNENTTVIGLDSISLLTLAAGGIVDLPHLNLRIVPSGDLARLQMKIKTRLHGSVRIQPPQPKKDIST